MTSSPKESRLPMLIHLLDGALHKVQSHIYRQIETFFRYANVCLAICVINIVWIKKKVNDLHLRPLQRLDRPPQNWRPPLTSFWACSFSWLGDCSPDGLGLGWPQPPMKRPPSPTLKTIRLTTCPGGGCYFRGRRRRRFRIRWQMKRPATESAGGGCYRSRNSFRRIPPTLTICYLLIETGTKYNFVNAK